MRWSGRTAGSCPTRRRYAYISPRAAGVVRTVDARVGQQVAKGDLLATIDSHEVAEARLALIGGLQKWEIARARAGWQSQTYEATCDLLAMLKAGAAPGEVHEGLADRAVGQNLERLITAYADFLRSDAKYARSVGLHGDGAVSLEAYQRAEADYHAAKATYKALTDSVAFQARLDHDAALLELQQAETAVNVARERLRVLGVPPDGDDRPGLPGVRVACDGPAPDAEDGGTAADPAVATTLGTYAILAPFDGTILDRERVVPGVHVDRTHRVFTIADLSTVYVEVMVHEAALGELAGRGPGVLRFTTPAYPDAVFEGRVLYSGDLVDERTRAVELLAEADNPGRRLKPGMFVDVEVISPRTRPAVLVPRSALLSDDGESFVYVRTGPEDFERRPVVPGGREGDRRAVDGGVEPGDEVVVRGAFKLKATATTGGE